MTAIRPLGPEKTQKKNFEGLNFRVPGVIEVNLIYLGRRRLCQPDRDPKERFKMPFKHVRYYDFYNCNHLILWYWQASTKQFMLSHDSWKVSWFANYGMSAVWELQYVKKNMMNSATFGPKSFAQLRNICYFLIRLLFFMGFLLGFLSILFWFHLVICFHFAI